MRMDERVRRGEELRRAEPELSREGRFQSSEWKPAEWTGKGNGPARPSRRRRQPFSFFLSLAGKGHRHGSFCRHMN